MNLGISGYETISAFNGREALDIINNGEHVDLALVDVMISEIDGFGLLEPLTHHHIPVIFLTAKGDIESKLQGLTGGAEDYIVKPFEMPELLVRMDKVLKRYSEAETTLHIGDIEIDISGRSVKKVKKPCRLHRLSLICCCCSLRTKTWRSPEKSCLPKFGILIIRAKRVQWMCISDS